ncbi:MAG: CDP-alcohol phosphatidyltransferase family protein [Paracoccus sp. (in: a-proteobacteria)]
MTDPENRRPLASRKTGWANRTARWLAGTRITPNQISQIGMVAALLAGLCFWAAGACTGFGRGLALLAGAGFCQLRLLCNLFDGMVAIEARRGAPDGRFWNEFPDRVSDALILIGLALGLDVPGLGWAAVSFAFLTAYVRELGIGLGQGADFSGPMAKQHRIALVTGAAVLSVFEPVWNGQGQILNAALWVMVVGAVLTVARRSWRLIMKLHAQQA